MEMSEIEREAILAQRQDEIQRFTDKRQLDMMFKQQSGRGGVEDNVSKAAKRTSNFCIPSISMLMALQGNIRFVAPPRRRAGNWTS